MRSSSPGAFALALLSCGPAATPGPVDGEGGAVLTWSVSQGLWGSERLTVSGDGAAVYSFRPVDGSSDPAVDGATQLSPTDLAHARDAMRSAGVCSLDADRLGVPDEAMTHLAVAMSEDLRCEVEVWDNDWQDRAPVVLAFLRDWIRRARGD